MKVDAWGPSMNYKLTYDGHGLNDPSNQYCQRVATFNGTSEERNIWGPRIVAALDAVPAFEKLLTLAEKQLDQSATHDGLTNCNALAKAREALKQAKEPTP